MSRKASGKDVFSLHATGVTVIEMFLGGHPWSGMNEWQAVWQAS